MAEEQKRKRQIAYKVTIENLKKYPYHQQEGWLPNYVYFQNKKISRVNIIGVVILKPISDQQNMIVVDDGTDQIEVRTFENDFNFNQFEIGGIVNIIGRIREFSNNRYIVPEIIKKTNDFKMLELRKKELKVEELKFKKFKIEETPAKVEEEIIEDKVLPVYEKIINEIKKLDKGDGASIQEVLINTNLIKREEVITELFQKGGIFEISPGKVKILE